MHELNVLHITATPKISENTLLIISDCKNADIFIAQQISIESDGTQIIKADINLSKRYEPYAEVSVFNVNTFYIGKTDRKNANGSPIYALYLKDLTHKTELVEGIVDMQARYMVSQNGIFF